MGAIFSNIGAILIALLALSIIVMVHEFGHFIAGKAVGMQVLEFSIGMGPKIVQKERKGTMYSLRWLPIGGYCRFLGEDESDDDPRAMNNISVGRRAIMVAAGAMMNFVFAFVVAALLLMFFGGDYSSRIVTVDEGRPAIEAGLMAGDKIVSVNGVAVETASQARTEIQKDPTQPITLTVEREGQLVENLVMTPVYDEASQSYLIGIAFGERIPLSFFEAIKQAGQMLVDIVTQMFVFLKNLIFKFEGAQDLGGPVRIVSILGDAAKIGFAGTWDAITLAIKNLMMFGVLISINLGVINLLPIPGMDGARLVFIAIEAIRGKPIPPEKEGMVHFCGLVFMMGLFVVLTFQDIRALIFPGT